MDILHINSYLNGSKFYINLYDKQIESGLNISTFVPMPKNDSIPNYFNRDYIETDLCFSQFDRIFFFRKQKKILRSILQKYEINKFDIIHAHSLFTNGYIAYKLYMQYNIPYIVAVRNSDVNVFFKKMIHLRKLGVKILQSASKIIFISESYKNNVIKTYVPLKEQDEFYSKSIVVPNGVEQFWLDNNKMKGSIENNKIKVVYIGDINKNKNLLLTVNCLNKLKKIGYEVEYNFAGKIVDKRIYTKIINYDFCKYYGVLNKQEILKLYLKTDIFVMPSLTETFGISYVEAMSQGLPVVYTKNQGFDNIFPEGLVGYHVNNDINELKNILLKILEKYEKISENCSNLCHKFNWKNINEQYFKIYQEIRNKK